MRSLVNSYAIYKKELRTYFTSFIAYGIMGVFLFLTGLLFHGDVITFDRIYSIGGYSITGTLFRQFFMDLCLIMLFTLPLLTMRLFAEEKKLGTMEFLMTYPLRDFEIIVGKFLACLTLFLLMLILTLLYPLLLINSYPFEWLPLFSGYLFIFLLGCASIAMGIFISSLTENQIVAAMGTYGIFLLFIIIAFTSGASPEWLEPILDHLSFIEHLDQFAKGVISTRGIIYSINFTIFFFILTLESLKSKRWRGLK
jgi:ABC-2 type transport system permease protein